MFVANMKTVIKDTEEHHVEEKMIESLDEMLTAYGVTHFFMEPTRDDLEDYEDAFLTVCYGEEQTTTFDLVYMLWCKTQRGATDEMIHKAMVRIVTK